jgi:hypothetical protein
MAEYFTANEQAVPDPLAMRLRDMLPDDYIVVGDPVIQRRAIDILVMGPQGLFVVYCKAWQGEIMPSRSGSWKQRLPSGEELEHPNPSQEVREIGAVLRTFLQDEFPSHRPTVQHLLALTHPEALLVPSQWTAPPIVTPDTIVTAITSVELPPDGPPFDREVRDALARALCERRLTVSQRATEPFVFRSGGRFGSGKQVWTIQAAVRHMDRYPEAGVFHLFNGTLAEWLSGQGAQSLASLAREVVRGREMDERIALERFLVGTGLVARPRLWVRPRKINLGFVPSGESNGTRFRVRKGRGRGYLFGTLRTSDPWLHIEPKVFSGRPIDAVVSAETNAELEAVVSADTQSLPISRKPWQGTIYIDSNASEEPTEVPVSVRVVAMPSRLNRALFRPLLAALAAAAFGAAAGWALGQWGAPAPQWYTGLTSPPMSSTLAWGVLIGFVWALLGWLRGRSQPDAWPIGYAMVRWLRRTLVWGGVLAALIAALVVVWGLIDPSSGMRIQDRTGISVVLGAFALAILPGALGEMLAARPPKRSRERRKKLTVRQRLVRVARLVVVLVVLAAGVYLLPPLVHQLRVSGSLSSVRQWAQGELMGWEQTASDLVDRLFIRAYDRRAPEATPTPDVSLTPSPTPDTGTQ